MSSLIVASSLAASAFALAALGAYANYRFIKRITEGEDSQ